MDTPREYEIRKVYKNKSNEQKVVTLPKDTKIANGDYVLIKKIDINENGENGKQSRD